jgi:hypothetical protein
MRFRHPFFSTSILLLAAAFSICHAQVKPVRPGNVQPQTVIPRALPTWKQVAILNPASLKVGTFYAGGINPGFYLQDDFVCGFSACLMHIMTSGQNPGRDLLFHIWQSQETLFGRIYVDLRGNRSGSRSFQIKITYLPQDIETFTMDTGGTLTVKTWLAADGNSLLGSPRVIATQNYAAKQGVAGRDEMTLIFTQQIGPNLFSNQSSPAAQFDLYGKPASQAMSGKVLSIELSKR